MSDLCPIGTLPELGDIPTRMLAQVVRQSRYGDPRSAFQIEEVPVPVPNPDEVLIGVMAAGINYNNVWAARGVPVDIIATRKRAFSTEDDFHIGGSDAAGVVYAVGDSVTSVSVGDRVVVHPGWWDPADPWVTAGRDPMCAPSARIWGYDGPNYGAFGQFAVAQEHQILPKPSRLSWEEAAAPTLVGTTAYRMLFGWREHAVQRDDVVLVWGGSGGVGIQAIQLAKSQGARPVAVVSSAERGEYCVRFGALGYIDRTGFDHWGLPPHWSDTAGQRSWISSVRAFGARLWEVLGEKTNPRIVIEHPGEATIPTSAYLCDRGGMIVICAGTTGYTANIDLRYHWVHQKRLQGSHGTNDQQARAYHKLLRDGEIDPAVGQVLQFADIPQAHYDMGEGVEVFGNRVALVGSNEPGLGVGA